MKCFIAAVFVTSSTACRVFYELAENYFSKYVYWISLIFLEIDSSRINYSWKNARKGSISCSLSLQQSAFVCWVLCNPNPWCRGWLNRRETPDVLIPLPGMWHFPFCPLCPSDWLLGPWYTAASCWGWTSTGQSYLLQERDMARGWNYNSPQIKWPYWKAQSLINYLLFLDF